MNTVRKEWPKLVDVEFEGIDHKDVPKYCDAFISSATWAETLTPLTDAELEEVNNDGELVYELLQNWLH